MTTEIDDSSKSKEAYNSIEVERGRNEWWEKQGYYTADNKAALNAPEDKKFVMVIPPPNVTGSLHLGHTLTAAIQDTLTRWHRMKGHATLWLPGVDHAGIATQSIVERQLMKTEGKRRQDLGREEFLKRVWEWKEKNGGRICYQLRRLGVSVDWSREAFTLSPELCEAVTEAFVRLFDRDLIYRDTRLVSWCPHLKTALSDIEVDTEDVDKPTRVRVPGYEKTVEVGMLWFFKYPVEGMEGKFLEVATTRLETMLGDVAVAVNPKDGRYADLVGKRLVHPFFPERDIRVVADDHVDMGFGTGAVKITPAHDKNDYDISKRQKPELPAINIFTLDGHINENGGEYAGMHRFQCRVELEKKLEELKLLTDKKPNEKKMQLPRCSRSGDIVENMLIPQWWMTCKDVGKRAVDVVRNGDLQISPESEKHTWYYWLENIKDWCISRQLWWGHQIPAYRIIFPGSENSTEEVWVAARSEEEAREKAEKKTGRKDFTLKRDEDVLDTWFSSALFPFSTMGWPNETEDMNAFFPTSLLETGHDILFFWVARMVMMSLLLLDKLPFKQVLLHAMVRDAHGKKMSKSLGNVIDPIEVIEGITLEEMYKNLQGGNLPEKEVIRAMDALKKDFPNGIRECGADALRYGLLAYTSQGRSINLDINRVVGYRFFCNKLYNVTKYSLSKFHQGFHSKGVSSLNYEDLAWSDKWILHRSSECARLTNEAFEKFDFGAAVTATYNFWLYELCDVYIELLKKRAHETAVFEVLFACLDRGLKMLHPMMPFLTEELYQRLPSSDGKFESISIAAFPESEAAWTNPILDDQLRILTDVVHQVRSLAVQLEIDSKTSNTAFVRVTTKDANEKAKLDEFFYDRSSDIACLTKMDYVYVATYKFPVRCIADVVSDKLEIALESSGEMNLAQAIAKLQKKLVINQKAIDGYAKKMAIANYERKVPAEVQAINKEKMHQLTTERAAIERVEANIKAAMDIKAAMN